MSAQESWALFDITRPQIEVELTKDLVDGAAGLYLWDEDRIQLDSTQVVWDNFGYFAQAHEYGHAIHNTALGGIPPGDPCPSADFRVIQETSLDCAFREGFATYHAVLTVGSLARYYEVINTGAINNNSDGDGALIEGAVASFFFDLTTNYRDDEEDFDDLDLPASYLGEVIATCDVLESGSWIRGNGVDHYVYCLENEVDQEVVDSPDYFPAREDDPEEQDESATEPSGWDPEKIPSLWRYNLYKTGN